MPKSPARNRKRAPRRRRRPRKPSLARLADKYDLYQRSVQEPEADVRFFNGVFRKAFGRRPHRLREDFCGTGYISTTWVKNHRRNEAWGFDIDREPLEWGRAHNAAALAPHQRERLHLTRGNALAVGSTKFDIVVALNFSYFLFRTRESMKTYFRAGYRNLARRGLFIIDALGGPDVLDEQEEITRFRRFRYVWDQRKYDPISNEMDCRIHYAFPDGSVLRNAFRYYWRLWGLPEIRELLAEAGFARSAVFWEGIDPKTDEGNGVFTLRERGEACDSWIAYIVGFKR